MFKGAHAHSIHSFPLNVLNLHFHTSFRTYTTQIALTRCLTDLLKEGRIYTQDAHLMTASLACWVVYFGGVFRVHKRHLHELVVEISRHKSGCSQNLERNVPCPWEEYVALYFH